MSNTKRRELILMFCQSIKHINSEQDAANFLSDLLTPQELDMLAKRILVAKRLLENKSYESIRNELKVGYSTIGRIATWLSLSGKGFRTVLSKIKSGSSQPFVDYGNHNLKRRFSPYYWPMQVIESILQSADQNHRKKINAILQSMIDNKNITKYYPDIASKYKKG